MTLRLIEEVGFAQAYSFKYSPRPGTPAAAMEDQVANAVKEERLARWRRTERGLLKSYSVLKLPIRKKSRITTDVANASKMYTEAVRTSTKRLWPVPAATRLVRSRA